MSFMTFENEDKKSPGIKPTSPNVKQERISPPSHLHNACSNHPEFSLDLNKHAGEQLFAPIRGQSGPFFSSATPACSKCNGEYTRTPNTQMQKSPLLQPHIRKVSSSHISQSQRWEPHTSHRMSFTTRKNADSVMASPSNLFSFSRDKLTPDTPKIVELSPASARSEKVISIYCIALITVKPRYNAIFKVHKMAKGSSRIFGVTLYF